MSGAERGPDTGASPPSTAAGHANGGAEHLVKMANDIGNFFRAEPQREDAIAGIANHIAKFWTRRMREKLTAHLLRSGDTVLDELPREALRRLAAPPAAQSSTLQTPAPQATAPKPTPPQTTPPNSTGR
jgi:formate dehydrogenase subunit delta